MIGSSGGRLLGSVLLGLSLASCGPGSRDLVADESGLASNLERLEVAVQDLDAVVAPMDTRAEGAAEAHGCRPDSGGVLEPEAVQSWTLTGPARSGIDPTSAGADLDVMNRQSLAAVLDIENQLVELGWVRLAEPGDEDASVALARDLPDHRLVMGVQGLGDVITASVTTTPDEVCAH